MICKVRQTLLLHLHQMVFGVQRLGGFLESKKKKKNPIHFSMHGCFVFTYCVTYFRCSLSNNNHCVAYMCDYV